MKNTKFKAQAILLASLFSLGMSNMAFAKTFDKTPKSFTEEMPDSFKEDINDLGEDVIAIQNYLDQYHDWRGLVHDQATYGAVTLKYLQLNGRNNVVVVKPGKKVIGAVQYHFDRDKCSSLHVYRVVIGLRGKGAQVTIGNELGMVASEGLEKFELVAPSEPGLYQVCFRLVESAAKEAALNAWVDHHGAEPDSTTAIGVILVKP